MLLLLYIKFLYVFGLIWDLYFNFLDVPSSDVAVHAVLITRPCDGAPLLCGSENILILISFLSLMTFLDVLACLLFLFFFFLAVPCGLRDLSSPTRD